MSSFQNIVLRCPSVSSALGLGGQILGLLRDPIAVCRNGETQTAYLFFYLWCIFTEKLRRLVQTDRKKEVEFVTLVFNFWLFDVNIMSYTALPMHTCVRYQI